MSSSAQLNPDIVARFAPSPNGLLHLGHAYAAMKAHDFARDQGGRFLLRIEDIDIARSKTGYVDAIKGDLRWLDLDWDGDIIFQSQRFTDYATAIDKLKKLDVTYPCFCTRSTMRKVQASEGLKEGPDGPIYPGICRHRDPEKAQARAAREPHSIRLDVVKAIGLTGVLTWHDQRYGTQIADPSALGDVVLVPKEMPVSYHVAVTCDDARDDITHVVRGNDLFASTHMHRLLQALLGLPTPNYVHHPLLLDDTGQKLSKSRQSASLAVLRARYPNARHLIEALRSDNFPVGISLSKD